MSSRPTLPVALAAVVAVVATLAVQRTNLLVRLGRGTTVRTVRPGAR
ncbi:hypothetical protein [Pseudonocardia parietis]|uniref:Uncharacterized protein n=1 Tax=Pseudonocardia parietis TaxID=570936 RepID=A0ABS4VN83_9PSEU|nr:hypothetical protein [Pseudonocardia parietis]MBP2365386.1 hypothetical protein [Pseudonocardia parietis]